MILMIDNYDSFTYNLVQYLKQLGEDVAVRRNDCMAMTEIDEMTPDMIVISPGPCTPEEAGSSLEIIRTFSGRIPILGICLGHQALASAFGARIVRAREPVHGKVHEIRHTGDGVFEGLGETVKVTRYHSLVVEKETVPDCFKITAWTEEGEIMGLLHRSLPIEGVQFHPEAILSEHGFDMLANFLRRAKEFKTKGKAAITRNDH